MMRRIAAIVFGLLFLFGCAEPQADSALVLKKDIGPVYGGYTFLSVQADGAWTLDVTFIGDQRDWLTLSKTSGSGTLNSIVVKFEKNEQAEDRCVEINARFLDGEMTVMFRQRGLSSLKIGGEGTVLPQWDNYPGLKSEVLPGWMELPAVYEIEGCAWVHHDMEVSVAAYKGRNYSIFYDASLYMPRWVAYPLTPALSGSPIRTEAWEQWDPKIPREFQPSTQSGWGLSDYHRGHMVPAADRSANKDANRQTYYPTNMTVQKGVLNSGVWASLEGFVRSWSKGCDTLYVVTGAVPSSRTHTDKDSKKVNIPAGYYKALLKYRKGKSVQDTYSGIAFYLDHETGAGETVGRNIAMPIAELEHKVGVNFFINLPDEYVDYAEGGVRYSDWGL